MIILHVVAAPLHLVFAVLLSQLGEPLLTGIHLALFLLHGSMAYNMIESVKELNNRKQGDDT